MSLAGKMDDAATDKTLYCIRHGESTYNEWRTKSLWNFTWMWVRDPMIVDAPLSTKGKKQVEQIGGSIGCVIVPILVDSFLGGTASRVYQKQTIGREDSSGIDTIKRSNSWSLLLTHAVWLQLLSRSLQVH